MGLIWIHARAYNDFISDERKQQSSLHEGLDVRWVAAMLRTNWPHTSRVLRNVKAQDTSKGFTVRELHSVLLLWSLMNLSSKKGPDFS